MSKLKIICNIDLEFNPDARKVLEEVASVDYIAEKYEMLLDRIAGCDAYFASASVKVDKKVLDRADKLKVIATPSTGTDHIDREYANKKGIAVIDIAKDYDLLDTFSATAEMAWGLLLACIRHLPEAFETAKKGVWARQRFTGRQLQGKTMGILGYGRLGKMMAKIGNGFRMKVKACDIRKIESPYAEQVDFKTLLTTSDILSIHIHLTKKNTRAFIQRCFCDDEKRGYYY